MANLRRRNYWKSKRRSLALERRLTLNNALAAATPDSANPEPQASQASRGLPPRKRPGKLTSPASRALLPRKRPSPIVPPAARDLFFSRPRPDILVALTSRGLPARRPPRQTTSPGPR
jgi:hypothetical protein